MAWGKGNVSKVSMLRKTRDGHSLGKRSGFPCLMATEECQCGWIRSRGGSCDLWDLGWAGLQTPWPQPRQQPHARPSPGYSRPPSTQGVRETCLPSRRLLVLRLSAHCDYREQLSPCIILTAPTLGQQPACPWAFLDPVCRTRVGASANMSLGARPPLP